MLTWGVATGLVSAGVIQGLNGDHLGATSYVFHAAILGTIGWNFKPALTPKSGAGAFFTMISFFCYCAFWFNCVFTIMAFRIAKMFGVLYATVALMFLMVGLNWAQCFHDQDLPKTDKDWPDRTGDILTGISCLIVALQCAYLLLPVMTGLGVL